MPETANPDPAIGWPQITELEKAERLIRRAVLFLTSCRGTIRIFDASPERASVYDRIGFVEGGLIDAAYELADLAHTHAQALRRAEAVEARKTFAHYVEEGNARNWDDGDPDPDPALVPFE